ncbi:vitamin B12 ABC transporter ATP-binding protein BtuD [Rouxiella sp. Mn2063]|uniref:vitamin B12 ABC transporter ATP-binding protein BtuD n=1 Tax=Rouxiella sp. Mn2063 TaxID=3395262 RepID=UPI003BCFB321
MLQLSQISVPGRFSAFTTQVPAGRRIHIIGPNGAGKSSLLARLAGMLSGEGQVLIDGIALDKLTGWQLAQRRAYLSQQQLPVSVMPVFQYLSLHQPATVQVAQLEQTINHLCSILRLLDKLAEPINNLSGGEWQRVRLVAALLQVWPDINPLSKLLLLDEPMNSLDIAQQRALDGLIEQFCATGRTAIISDHDLNHSLQLADDVWLMSQGQIEAAGKVDEVMQPERLSKIFDVEFVLNAVAGKAWLMMS